MFYLFVYMFVSCVSIRLSGRGGSADRRGTGGGRDRADRIGGGATATAASSSSRGSGSGACFHWIWFLIVIVIHRPILELGIRWLRTIIHLIIHLFRIATASSSHHLRGLDRIRHGRRRQRRRGGSQPPANGRGASSHAAGLLSRAVRRGGAAEVCWLIDRAERVQREGERQRERQREASL